jgi:NADH-quinone oxidoreductase subunit M
MYKKVVFGEITNPKLNELTDLNFREKLVLIPIFIFIVWIGIYPSTFLNVSSKTSEHIIKIVTSPQIQIPEAKVDASK